MATREVIPSQIADEQQLDQCLTTPSEELIDFARQLQGDLLILGAGGKMGPSLAVRAKRAIDEAGGDQSVIAVSRFSDEAARQWLEDQGIVTHSVDLFDRDGLKSLPDAPNVLFLVGSKFGTSQNPSRTWAVNTVVPALVMERFHQSNIVALSTGNVYPFTSIDSGGAKETDLLGPIGEYANAALGRERVFEYFARENDTPVVIVRLNYAVDLRYGVLTDIGTKVRAGKPVDVANGYLNCIWQGDANDAIIRSLGIADTPPAILNLTGPETLSVREVAKDIARLLGTGVEFTGKEAESALLSNAGKYCQTFGSPKVSTGTMIRWTADWLRGKGRLLNKSTHFEVRDGTF